MMQSCSFPKKGLCSWVVNIVGFFVVYCDVEPKRKALAAANAELATAQEKLGKIKAKIKVRTCLYRSCSTINCFISHGGV